MDRESAAREIARLRAELEEDLPDGMTLRYAKQERDELKQMIRLGASCDWTRTAFTMDEHLSRAVRTAFVQLWEKGLIYRDKRLVNWDPLLHTAISDLEVEPVLAVGPALGYRNKVELVLGRGHGGQPVRSQRCRAVRPPSQHRLQDRRLSGKS